VSLEEVDARLLDPGRGLQGPIGFGHANELAMTAWALASLASAC
jgi:hypothetical protein